MRKELKAQLIDSLYEQVSSYPHLYIADIGGLDSVQTSKLRRLAFRREVKLVVVKNTLLIKALERTGIDYSELYPVIKGETAIMLSNSNNAPAKLIKEFRATAPKPILKGAYVEEAFYVGDENLETLVNIKSKNELIADVVALLQSPIKNVVSALQSGGNTLSGVLKTLSEKSE
ncbi:MAG: 50S ribosomal protein L10 [Bacteroidales bacterium]|jgi:large subunit ribosomal protein L10|nr:50S ribosomal protein L10 [Bacteroidales bacterium]